MSIDIATLRPKLEAALGAQLQLGALLGEGGFAAVFRAHDPFLERDVAIKVLDPSLAVDAAREEQFLHEARTIAAAEHPHIVPLYSAESTGGLLYLVMRLLSGQSLKDRIAAGKLPVALVRLVDRMLSKEPAGRPTAAELVKELTAASTPDGLLTPSQVRRRRWKRRGIYLAIAAVSAVPVVVIGARILLLVMAFWVSGGEGADP